MFSDRSINERLSDRTPMQAPFLSSPLSRQTSSSSTPLSTLSRSVSDAYMSEEDKPRTFDRASQSRRQRNRQEAERRREEANKNLLKTALTQSTSYHTLHDVELETKEAKPEASSFMVLDTEAEANYQLTRALYIASNTLKHAHNQVRPMKGFLELGLLLPFAMIKGLASSATSKSFGESSVRTVESNTVNLPSDVETALNNIVFVPALLTQLCFAMISNVNLDIKIKRYLETVSPEELSQAKYRILKALLIVAPSATPTFIMGLNALSPYLTGPYTPLLFTICLLRSCAALGMNGDFYTQNEKSKRGHKELALIQFLINLQTRIKDLTRNEGTLLIKRLSDQGIFKDLDRIDTAKPEDHLALCQTILSKLVFMCPEVYSVMPSLNTKAPYDLAEESRVRRCLSLLSYKLFTRQHAATAFGLYASLINLSAALTVPAYMGLEKPDDLIGVFAALAFSDVNLGLSCLLGLSIGMPSFYVNFLINSIAVLKFINKLEAIRKNGWRTEYDNNAFRFGLTIFLSFLYGMSVGGSSAIYAFVAATFARFLNMILNTFVFTAIGSMSFDGAYQALNNAWYHVSSNRYAFAADNLYDYYLLELLGEPDISPVVSHTPSASPSPTPDSEPLDDLATPLRLATPLPTERTLTEPTPVIDKHKKRRVNLVSASGNKINTFITGMIERIDGLSPADQAIFDSTLLTPEVHARLQAVMPEESKTANPAARSDTPQESYNNTPFEFRETIKPSTESPPYRTAHMAKTKSRVKFSTNLSQHSPSLNGSTTERPSFVPSLDLSTAQNFMLFSSSTPRRPHATATENNAASSVNNASHLETRHTN